MGQQTSRTTGQQSINHCYSSHYNGAHEWPRWASGLTQGLPQDGDRGLFRGEFILVQAQPAVEAHPQCMQLYTRQYHPSCIASTGISENSIQSGRNVPSLRLNRETHSHLYSQMLKTRLGHIPEEDDEEKQETTARCANESRTDKYKEKDRRILQENPNSPICEFDKLESDDETFHYFANNLIKPAFVTSHRYGSFQTMTSRYSCIKPREDVRALRSLPRQKNINNGTTNVENNFSKSHFLNLADYGVYKNIQFPRCSTISRNENIYDIAYVPEKKRPPSPIKDYSSSEYSISDSDDLATQFIPSKKLLYTRRRRKPHQTSSKCRRHSSSADSAFKDIDNFSPNSSGRNECNIKAKTKMNLNTESKTGIEEIKYQKFTERGRRKKHPRKTEKVNNNVLSTNQESDHYSKQSSEDDADLTSSLSSQFNNTLQENDKHLLMNDEDSEWKTKSERMLSDVTSNKTNSLMDSEIDRTKSNSDNSRSFSELPNSKIHKTKSENYETISSNKQRNHTYLPCNISQTSSENCNPYETVMSKSNTYRSTSLPASPEIRHDLETKNKSSAQQDFLTLTPCSSDTSDKYTNKQSNKTPCSSDTPDKYTNKQSNKTRIQELQDILIRKSLPLSSPKTLFSSQSSSPSPERSFDLKSENSSKDICENWCKSPRVLRRDYSSNETSTSVDERLNLSNLKLSANHSPTNRNKSDCHNLKSTDGEEKDEIKVRFEDVFKEKPSIDWINEVGDKNGTFSPPPAPPLPESFKVSRTTN